MDSPHETGCCARRHLNSFADHQFEVVESQGHEGSRQHIGRRRGIGVVEFRRSEEFNRPGANAYGNQGYYGSDPSTWGVGAPGDTGVGYAPTPQPVRSGPMTIDTVVQKTGLTLGVVIVAAMATWILTPDIVTTTDAFGNTSVDTSGLGALFAAATIGSLGAFA